MKGSITVFASLCMLFVLAFLLVVIQSSGVEIGMDTADNQNLLATKAVMGEFNKEIFDNYHIMVMDGGFGDKKFDDSTIRGKVESYVDVNNNHYSNFTGMTYSQVNDIDYTYITDSDGELFQKEVVEYMKYKVGKNFVDKYFSKFTKFKGIGTTQKIMKKKQKVAQSAEEISENMLELMGLVDGIKSKNGSLVYSKYGDLEFEDAYLKMIVYDNTSQQAIGYMNDEMFKYRHYKSTSLDKKLTSLQKHYEKWIQLIEDNDKEKQSSKKEKCKSIVADISDGIKGAKKSCEKAIKLIDKILKQKDEYEKLNKEYKKYLNSQKSNMSQELYDSFLEDEQQDQELLDMLPDLKKKLQSNLKQLEEMEKLCDFSVDNDVEKINESIEKIAIFRNKAKAYSVSDIVFDYGDLKLEKESEGIVEAIVNVFQNGVISLVTDEDELSSGKLTGSGYPSQKYVNKAEKALADIIEDVISGDIKGAINGVGNLFNSMAESVSGIDVSIMKNVDELADKVLFNQYILENFNMYHSKSSSSSSYKIIKENLDHQLDYEMEYILFGNKTDRANIKAMVNRLLKIRTMCNVISLLSDSSKRKNAHDIAVAVFGFTGMPVIINIATVVIEVVWGYEESLIDVAAMMKGYSIPIIKGKGRILVQVEDLLRISKTYVQSKSENYAKEKVSLTCVDYDTYLEMFLLLEENAAKSFRCMDLIQANINNSYGVNMRMENCIYGMRTTIDYNINLKYANFKFIRKMTGGFNLNNTYSSRIAFSY